MYRFLVFARFVTFVLLSVSCVGDLKGQYSAYLKYFRSDGRLRTETRTFGQIRFSV
jgi:hypothetical protein